MLKDLYICRNEKDLSQDELARLAGISKSAIHQIENGKSIPRADTICYLAHALGMSPGDLFNKLIDEEDFAMKREAY